MSNGINFREMAVDLRAKLTAAQSELAALREELALAKQLASAWKEQERLRGIQALNAGEALTAAEQRNAELERALSGMLFAFDDGVGHGWSRHVLDFARRLIAAEEFKPTESGASEQKCCDRFPKCVCYEGADGL